jgi:RHS repeat-associated protein
MTQDNLGDTYSYDAEGRQIKVNGNATTFDAFNRLAQIQSGSTYTQTLYSPNGQKFAYMNRTTLIKYIDPMVAGMKAVYNGSGLQYYRHSDWLGTNRFSATPSGTVYFDGAYAPYAENYAGIGTSDRVFTGQPMGTLPGLYDFTFREYGQSQGRWLVPDPAGLAAVDITNPQTWNRYAYVGNNPLNTIDPYGLYRDDCWWTGGCYGPGGPGAGGGGGGGYYGGGSTPCTMDGISVSCGSIGGLGSNGYVMLPSGFSTATSVPGGFAFPSADANGTISYAFSFPAQYSYMTGVLITADAWAEVLGLPTAEGSAPSSELAAVAAYDANHPSDVCPSGLGTTKKMLVTGYDNSFQSTGKNPGDPQYGITRSGAIAAYGTIAAPTTYSFGTNMYVPGYGLGTVQDRGGSIKGSHIDVWFSTTQAATNWGAQRLRVTVCK